MKIILASASPRRQELLHFIYHNFDIMTSDADEFCDLNSPEQYVKDLAYQKAHNVAMQIENSELQDIQKHHSYLIIGADTIVYDQGHVLGKPHDRNSARSMLSGLSGHSHQVFTGVSILLLSNVDGEIILKTLSNFTEETKVHVCALSSEEIESYIETGDPMDKAGAYGIQGPFGKYISRIEGDYYNVVGLPVSRLYQELKPICND